MKNEELFDALDGFFAYDGGAWDSGISDNNLREKVKKYLQECKDTNKKLLEFIHTHYKPEDGYTIEDTKEFIEWIENEMDYYIN